jgi:flagellar secretion chaperone FliS
VSHYDNYIERSILTASPMELVRMLYGFVIENLAEASRCVETGDIAGRGNAVSKATDGLVELLTSLDHQQGGEVSARLAELYSYIVSRILQGHVDQDAAPFRESEKLMATLLESWEDVGQIAQSAGGYGVTPEAYTPISASF